MLSKKVSVIWGILAALVMFLALLIGCSSSDQGGDSAVPSFCPTNYARDLPAPLALTNTPPRAYYQSVSTTVDTDLDITLLACDPDDPTTAAGMTWQVTDVPLNGRLSGALSGTYSSEPYQVTYIPAQTGTDTFYYQVMDAEGATSDVVEVQITVTPPQAVGTSLYFGGWDDQDNYNLWTYNNGSGLSTVSGTASELTPVVSDSMVDRKVFGGRLYFLAGIGDGGGALYSYDISSGLYSYASGFGYTSNMTVMGGNLYIGIQSGGGYIWSIDSSGIMTSLPNTAGLSQFDQNLEAFAGTLFFDSYVSPDQMLWTRDGGGVLTTHSGPTYPAGFTPFNNDLYFAGDALGSRTLWRFNGSGPASTVGPLTLQWGAPDMAVIDSVLCMNAYINTAVGQLWSYHPARGFAALTNNTVYSVYPNNMTSYSGYLFFNGYDDSDQSHLWYTDGAATVGTVPGSAGLEPRYMAQYDGKLFFAGGIWPDVQLWYIDSSLSAPTKVSNISSLNQSGGLNPSGLVEY